MCTIEYIKSEIKSNLAFLEMASWIQDVDTALVLHILAHRSQL